MVVKKSPIVEDERTRTVITQYAERLGYLRKAQEFSQKDETVNAVICYNKYLGSLAAWHKTTEEKLSPKNFNKESDAPEMLLISQVYWDLSKAYDRNPKLVQESIRCLGQFKKFTIGFKYQYINSEMLRKFIKKSKCHHPKNFENAYKDIRVNSKKCYIATYCYGEEHEITRVLRLWKACIIHTRSGDLFVECYYRISPLIIHFYENHPRIGNFSQNVFLKPFLQAFSKVVSKFIIS